MSTRVPNSDSYPVGCDVLSLNEVRTIRELIDGMARTQGANIFLISPETGRLLTFANLQRQSRVVSAHLRKLGLERGDKAAFLLDNGLFTAQLFLGTMYGGMVTVPLNVRAGVSQLAYTLEHCDAKVVFVEEQYKALCGQVLAEVKRPLQVISVDVDGFAEDGRAPIDDIPLTVLEAEHEALLMYTSGSVGQPKAAIHSHRTILAQARNSICSHELTASDRSLLLLPLYHINAECVTLIPTLLSGGSVVVPHRFSVSQFWDWLEEYHCTWSAIVPTIVSQLLDWDDPRAGDREAAFQRIRFLRSSSAPLSPALHREFLDKFKMLLIQAMGSSEAGNIFSNPQPPGKNKIGSPGLAWGFDTRVVDRDGADVRVGEPGEILIRGSAVMEGYYKDPQGTQAVLDAEGWLHTGDLAYQDADGYFYVVGRSKELIIKAGVNIAPKQIDEVLESHPAVLEAAAVGVPDRYVGEDLVAFVVLRSGMAADETEMLAFCESRLGQFKTPTRIYFVTDLPKGPSGKVQRLRLIDKVPQPSSAVKEAAESAAVAGIEQSLIEIWAEILGKSPIDPNSNFFSLGGHSLLAIQCLSRMRSKLPIALSLSDFFEHATIAQQAALVRQRLYAAGGAQVTPEQSSPGWEQALLQQIEVPAAHTIPRRENSAESPLSPAQRRIWFFEKLVPGVPLYNESEAVRLVGALNVEAMEQALNVIIARHEVLRSTIRIVNGEPFATVHESWPLRIKRLDLSELPSERCDAEVQRLLVDEPRCPYHLETEPGIRATLLRTGPKEHVFILMMHHLVCDWGSEGVLWRELSVLYRALSRGEVPALTPLSIQHGDYAAWQQKQVADASFEEDLAYWEEKLRGAPELLELPADRPRLPELSYRGKRQRFRIGAELVAALRECSRREQTSLFTVFAAAWNALFYRYTGFEDISLGIPLADRDRPEVQSVIGFLLHTHVLRTTFSGKRTFRDLIAQVRKGVLDLYAHRAVPFDQVVGRLRPERNLGHSPLFQVMINWRDREQQLAFIGMEGLEVESLLAESRTSKFDLTLMLTECEDEIWLEIEYSTDLFDDSRIARMFGHYQVLLESVASDSSQRLSDLPILTREERHQLLVEWNDTGKEYGSGECLHELFEKQVQRTPDAVAVQFEDKQLTYRELNNRANQLAHCLRDLGVGPDSLVAIFMERSLEMVIALYGVLKAGGAYVPIDPEYPQERVAFMLEDAEAPVLLTHSGLSGRLPHHPGRVMCLDSEWESVARQPETNLDNIASSNNLAYVIYTSGSTGKPKGAMNTHRGICNRLLWMQDQYRLTEVDKALQKTPFSFDVSVWEFFWPLLMGARLVVAAPGGHRDPAYLAKLIRERQITVLHFVPSMLRAFLDEPSVATCQSLRHVMCSGEALPYDLQDSFFGLLSAQLHNLYGPTEAAVDVTHWTCLRHDERKIVPIGRPVANTQIYLLDSNLRPVPIGIPGELYIGGVQVGRGYHRRPDLTAEKFIPDPFAGHSQSRLYKTGDMCRWLSDGAVEYLGRLDFQVKIRGLRIELGEIEDALRQHQAVREAAVVLQEKGEKQLAAFVVSAKPAASSSELREYLKQKLPEYMVPAAWAFLPALPLSPNGKVDRKALQPLGARAVGESNAAYAPLKTKVERRIAAIFQEVLGITKVGRDDNFFDLGGSSLLLLRIHSRLQQAFAKEIALVDMFRWTSVRALAQHLAGQPAFSGADEAQVEVEGRNGAMRRRRQLRRRLADEQATATLEHAPRD